MYTSIHLIIDNILKDKYNVDKEISKFAEFLNMKDVKETSKFMEDDDYMAGIVKVEDLMRNVDEVGLLYDYEEEIASRMIDEHDTGYDEGLEKGIEQGIEQGKKNNQKEIAIRLKNTGMEDREIINILNISLDELNSYLGR